MKRTDIHRPSAINPQDYQFVAYEHVKLDGDLGASMFIAAQRKRIQDHMYQTGGAYSTHSHGGNCHVCGNANAMYTILFHHAPSNTYIRTGEDCAEKMDMAHADINTFRKEVSKALEAKAGKAKAQALLAEIGLADAWQISQDYQNAPALFVGRENPTEEELRIMRQQYRDQEPARIVNDIVLKLVKFGSISERAQSYLGSLVEKVKRMPEIKAQREAEREAAAPCPSGRITVTGTIVKVDTRETAFGMVTKMLVKATEGFMVWSTLPSGAPSERGTTITFKATVRPSDEDPKFGFASRPYFIAA
jgi:hypothetical protein